MLTQLSRIAEKARTDRKLRFTSLAHVLTPEFLRETWGMMNRRGASGVDQETTHSFERYLDERVQDIHKRLKDGRYKAPPVRRVEIPKGEGKTRPLGIPTVEDRLVQRAVARILEAIFEANFLEVSYGFRPGRNPHQALRVLRQCVITKKVRYVFEADIQGYFNHINHEWLMRMLAERVADPIILRLIRKWLRAGAMVDGVRMVTGEGTPQGGPISPILANIYLHYVLDLWFERRFKQGCQGEAYLVRFADDYVTCFQYKHDAERFHRELIERLRKFGLELSQEKTRMILFGRFAAEEKARYGERPETFDFLGFTHVCGKDRNGRFAVIRIPCRKSLRKFLDRVHDWLVTHRHWKRRDQQKYLTMMLNGFYQYFGLIHCERKLNWVRVEVQRQWLRALRRRGQRHWVYWSYVRRCAWFDLPYPKAYHPAV